MLGQIIVIGSYPVHFGSLNTTHQMPVTLLHFQQLKMSLDTTTCPMVWGMGENCPLVENHCSIVKSKVRMTNCQNPASNFLIHMVSLQLLSIFLKLYFLVFYIILTCHLWLSPYSVACCSPSPCIPLELPRSPLFSIYSSLFFTYFFQINMSLNLFYCLWHIKRACHFPPYNIWDILISETGKGKSYFEPVRGVGFLCSLEDRSMSAKKGLVWSWNLLTLSTFLFLFLIKEYMYLF